MTNLWLALQSLYALAFARNDNALITSVGASMSAVNAISCKRSFGLHTEFGNPAPVDAQEIEDIFALLDAPAISNACAEYNAIEDVQFEALGELSALRAIAEASIREHLQSGGLLTDDTQTVSRLIRGRASMAMRAFPA